LYNAPEDCDPNKEMATIDAYLGRAIGLSKGGHVLDCDFVTAFVRIAQRAGRCTSEEINERHPEIDKTNDREKFMQILDRWLNKIYSTRKLGGTKEVFILHQSEACESSQALFRYALAVYGHPGGVTVSSTAGCISVGAPRHVKRDIPMLAGGKSWLTQLRTPKAMDLQPPTLSISRS
jgi:hypothetical protein